MKCIKKLNSHTTLKIKVSKKEVFYFNLFIINDECKFAVISFIFRPFCFAEAEFSVEHCWGSFLC